MQQLEAALQAVFDAEDALLARGALAGPATYFELTTAAAFVLFRTAGVEVAVIEVGLGRPPRRDQCRRGALAPRSPRSASITWRTSATRWR